MADLSNAEEAMARLRRDDLADGLAVEVEIAVRLHRNGSMSVAAPLGDKDFCLRMLDEAKDAIRRHGTERTLVVPERDVDAKFIPIPERMT